MPEPKLYVPKSSAREKQFDSGGSIIRLSFHAATLVEFVKNHTNEKGWINLNVSERREVSQHGDTHSVSLDTWKPTGQAGSRQPDSRRVDRADLPPGGLMPEARDNDDNTVPF